MVDMDPEQLLKAGEQLYNIENDIYDPTYNKLPFEMLTATSSLTNDGLSMGAALGDATGAWIEQQIVSMRADITNQAQFLVVHSQTMVSIDEFNAEEFVSYDELIDIPRADDYQGN